MQFTSGEANLQIFLQDEYHPGKFLQEPRICLLSVAMILYRVNIAALKQAHMGCKISGLLFISIYLGRIYLKS